MYNVNYVLAKALQQDQLRGADKERINRLWQKGRKTAAKQTPKILVEGGRKS